MEKESRDTEQIDFYGGGRLINFPMPIAMKKMARAPIRPDRAVDTFSFLIHGIAYSGKGAYFQNVHPSPFSENPFVFATFSNPSGEEEAKGERKRARSRETPNPIQMNPSSRLFMEGSFLGITDHQIRPCFQDEGNSGGRDDGLSNANQCMNPCHSG